MGSHANDHQHISRKRRLNFEESLNFGLNHYVVLFRTREHSGKGEKMSSYTQYTAFQKLKRKMQFNHATDT